MNFHHFIEPDTGSIQAAGRAWDQNHGPKKLRPEVRQSYMLGTVLGTDSEALTSFLTGLADICDAPRVPSSTEHPGYALGLRTASAVLRNQAPLVLNRALIKGADTDLGWFTIEIGLLYSFPISVHVGKYADDGELVRLGCQGEVLCGLPDRQLFQAPGDFAPALALIASIAAKGRIYCATPWQDDRFTLDNSNDN